MTLPIGSLFGKLVGKSLGGHRALSHSLIGIVLFGFLGKVIFTFLSPIMHSIDTGYVWNAFMIGYISHLGLDALTKEGIPLFLPLHYKIGFPPIKRLRIVTGKKAESFFVFPALVLFNILFYTNHLVQVIAKLHSIR